MLPDNIKDILRKVSEKSLSPDKAYEKINKFDFEDLGFAKVDHNRNERTGFPEVIFCENKTPVQVAKIAQKIVKTSSVLLASRASDKHFREVKKVIKNAVYHKEAQMITYKKKKIDMKTLGNIAVICAGTSDIPIAEEAAVTADIMGNKVDRLYDVGVAGIHRLFAHIDVIRKASVLIVVAGMEGALPSVIGGLVTRPVIAVPTSIGYGASFKGVAALLGMLNSCASGVTVVNIDNGFGAGFAAAKMNRLPKA